MMTVVVCFQCGFKCDAMRVRTSGAMSTGAEELFYFIFLDLKC